MYATQLMLKADQARTFAETVKHVEATFLRSCQTGIEAPDEFGARS